VKRIAYLGLTNAEGPTTRYRFLQYAAHLRAAGLEPECLALHGTHYLAAERHAGVRRQAERAWSFTSAIGRRLGQLPRAVRADVVVVEREVLPFAPPFFELGLSRLGRGYVIEVDDAIHLSRGRRHKMRTAFGLARAVIAGNAVLAEAARPYCRELHVVPTCVEVARYQQAAAETPKRRGAVTFGWIGLPTSFVYLEQLDAALAEVSRRTGARFTVCSSRRPRLSFDYDFVPWSLAQEVNTVAGFDVGLMPLADDAFSRGKCGLKALQYMAAGVATVLSPVGVNADIARGDAARTATSATEWVEALCQLLTDPADRTALAARGLERVRREFDTAVWGPRLAELYRGWAGLT
jgi:glycosyltransferase involved in cell wall biosynthesis